MGTLSKIIELINKKGIKENVFLADLGFNKSALSDWKKGTTQSYVKHITKIAAYFNVTTDYLLGNEPKDILDDALIGTSGDARDYNEAELAEIKTFLEFIKAKRSNANDTK